MLSGYLDVYDQTFSIFSNNISSLSLEKIAVGYKFEKKIHKSVLVKAEKIFPGKGSSEIWGKARLLHNIHNFTQ